LATGQSTSLVIGGVSTRIRISILLTDALGRSQSVKIIRAEPGENTVPLNIAGLPRGMYYVQVSGDNGFYKVLPLGKL